MRTDLWDTDEWVSPSPEDEVRARVRRRARSLSRRRTVPMFAVLLLAAMMAIQQLPSTQSSSYVRVTGEGEHEEGRAEEPSASDEEAAEDQHEVAAGTTTSSTTTTSSLPRRIDIEEPINAGVGFEPASPYLAEREDEGPLFVDPEGDAFYNSQCPWDTCGGTTLDDTTPSQPAFDFTATDIRCTDKAMRLSLTLVDPDDVPDANSRGHRVRSIWFNTGIWFDDGTANGGSIVINLARDVSTRALSVRQAYLSTGDEAGTGTGQDLPAESVVVRQVGRSLVVDVQWDALSAATRASRPDRRPPGPGTAFVMSTQSSALLEYAPNSSYGGGHDLVGDSDPDRRYRLCG